MKNIDIQRFAVHECCHAVVALFYRHRMAIDGIAVQKELVEKGDDQGVLYLIGPPLDCEQDFTALGLSYLAGVVGENMYVSGIDSIKKIKEEIIADNSILDWSTAGGDLPAFGHVADIFSMLYQIDVAKFKEFCLLFLIDFLGEKEIWAIVEKLCGELLNKDDLAMSGQELDSFFLKSRVDQLFELEHRKYHKKLDTALRSCV